MIELYAGPTPNGQKVAIALEELGFAYVGHHIDILRGDQLTPEFLAINPNNKQPAIADIALLPYALTGLRRSRLPRPHLEAWAGRLQAREPVQRGLAIMHDEVRRETLAGGMVGYGHEHRDVLFGDRQFAERP